MKPISEIINLCQNRALEEARARGRQIDHRTNLMKACGACRAADGRLMFKCRHCAAEIWLDPEDGKISVDNPFDCSTIREINDGLRTQCSSGGNRCCCFAKLPAVCRGEQS
jgi:hypothetical protein